MGARHRAQADRIHILKVQPISAEDAKRPHIKVTRFSCFSMKLLTSGFPQWQDRFPSSPPCYQETQRRPVHHPQTSHQLRLKHVQRRCLAAAHCFLLICSVIKVILLQMFFPIKRFDSVFIHADYLSKVPHSSLSPPRCVVSFLCSSRSSFVSSEYFVTISSALVPHARLFLTLNIQGLQSLQWLPSPTEITSAERR